MIYSGYKKGQVPDTIEVYTICSKCHKTHMQIMQKVSKMTMSLCPYCGNIDIERTDGKIPIAVQKQLQDWADENMPYTVNNKPLGDIVDELNRDKLAEKDDSLKKSYSGLYRLKTYYTRATKNNTLDLNSFPDFETFMRWSINHGYRDWKTLEPDANGLISVNSVWVPGCYNTKNMPSETVSIVASAMGDLHKTRQKLNALLTDLDVNDLESTPDSAIIANSLINVIRAINAAEENFNNNF